MIEEQKKKMDFIFDFANKNNAIVLSAGDQTDTPRDFLSFSYLFEAIGNLNTEFYCCLGQHDKYMRTKNPSSINLMIKLGVVNHLSKEPININEWNVYGCDFGDEVPEPETENNILVIHESITTKELAIKHVDFIDAKEFLIQSSKYDIILCGDIHRRFILEKDGRYILNSGPILRDEASQYFIDYVPGFYFLKNGKIDFIEIPYNKDVISRGHIELKENRDSNILDFDIKTETRNIDKIILSKIKEDKDSKELRSIIYG